MPDDEDRPPPDDESLRRSRYLELELSALEAMLGSDEANEGAELTADGATEDDPDASPNHDEEL